jgi:hypothetical protein
MEKEMSEQPQEWTPEYLEQFWIFGRGLDRKAICDARNAALARLQGLYDDMWQQFLGSQEELVAEREKYADTEADGIVFCGKCGAKL